MGKSRSGESSRPQASKDRDGERSFREWSSDGDIGAVESNSDDLFASLQNEAGVSEALAGEGGADVWHPPEWSDFKSETQPEQPATEQSPETTQPAPEEDLLEKDLMELAEMVRDADRTGDTDRANSLYDAFVARYESTKSHVLSNEAYGNEQERRRVVEEALKNFESIMFGDPTDMSSDESLTKSDERDSSDANIEVANEVHPEQPVERKPATPEFNPLSSNLSERAGLINEALRSGDTAMADAMYDVFVDEFQDVQKYLEGDSDQVVKFGNLEQRKAMVAKLLDDFESTMLYDPESQAAEARAQDDPSNEQGDDDARSQALSEMNQALHNVHEKRSEEVADPTATEGIDDIIKIDRLGRAHVPAGNNNLSGTVVLNREKEVLEANAELIRADTKEYDELRKEAAAQATNSVFEPLENKQPKSKGEKFEPLQNKGSKKKSEKFEPLENKKSKDKRQKFEPLENKQPKGKGEKFEPLQNKRTPEEQAKLEARLDTIAIARGARAIDGNITYKQTKKILKNILKQPERQAKAEADAKKAKEAKDAKKSARIDNFKGMFSSQARFRNEQRHAESVLAGTYEKPETNREVFKRKKGDISAKIGSFWDFLTPTKESKKDKKKNNKNAKSAKRKKSKKGK